MRNKTKGTGRTVDSYICFFVYFAKRKRRADLSICHLASHRFDFGKRKREKKKKGLEGKSDNESIIPRFRNPSLRGL